MSIPDSFLKHEMEDFYIGFLHPLLSDFPECLYGLLYIVLHEPISSLKGLILIKSKLQAEDGGSRIFAYGYIDGNICLIECQENGGEMSFTVKAETEEYANQFKEFWLGLFSE